MKKRILAMIMASMLVISNTLICSAETKTAVGLENNQPDGTSDAEAFVNGIKGYDSGYTTEYKNPSKVTASDFWSKDHTIKYWSSHGYNTGVVKGASNEVEIDIFSQPFSWAGGELEFVFLAACRQLDGSNKNPRSRYANAMVGNKAVRVICGYHESAPASIDKQVADKFIEYAKTGESVKSSWILANKYFSDRGYSTNVYCVLTHSGNVQYSRFPGFPGNTYTRPGSSSTKILRFSSANPNGTEQTYGLRESAELADIEIPTYVLRATPIQLNVTDNMNMTVLRDENNLMMVGAEIGDQQVNITEAEAAERCKEQLNNAITNYSEINMDTAMESVTPIVMAEVNLDGGNEQEVTVAYDISFKNTYDGLEIIGDYMTGIIDDSSTVYLAGNWNEMEKVDMMQRSAIVDYNTAYNQVIQNVASLADVTRSSDSDVVSNTKLAFVLNESTGYYEPTWVFSMEDSSVYGVNCISGKMEIMN